MLSYWTGPIDGRSYLDTEFETFYTKNILLEYRLAQAPTGSNYDGRAVQEATTYRCYGSISDSRVTIGAIMRMMAFHTRMPWTANTEAIGHSYSLLVG